ncbi:MAG: diacylglycerol/lipid kinase family protein [Polyangiales bacterium]
MGDRIAVIVNGNAKSVTEEVLATLDEILETGDLFVSRSVEEGLAMARTIVERGYGTVLTGGGDGTFTSVVTQVVRASKEKGVPPPRFGLLRLGTGNSLAWVVGATGAGGEKLAADVLRLRDQAGSRPLRLVDVEGYLAPFCGFGIDANVLHDFHRVRDAFRKLPIPRRFTTGLLSYAVAAGAMSMPKYLVNQTPFVRVTNIGADAYKIGDQGRPLPTPIRAGERLFEGKARMVSASTIPYYGFGFRVFPYADERPDRMALRITTIGPVEFLSNAKSLWRGEYISPTSLFDFLVEKVRIEIEPSTAFQIGGDAMGDRTTVEVSLADPIELVDFYAPPRA